jgi:hypothetical protein
MSRRISERSCLLLECRHLTLFVVHPRTRLTTCSS